MSEVVIIPNTDRRIRLHQVVNNDRIEKGTLSLPVIGWSIDAFADNPRLFNAVPITVDIVRWYWFLSIPQGRHGFIYVSPEDDYQFDTFDEAVDHCCDREDWENGSKPAC